MDGVIDIGGGVVSHLDLHASGQLLPDLVHLGSTTLDHVHRIRIGQNKDAHEDSFLPGEPHLRVIVFRAEHNIGDITQPNECAIGLTDHQLLELLSGMQIGVRRQVDLKKRAFGASDGREIIVLGQRVPNIRGADVERSHPLRLHPDAHGEGAAPEDIRRLHASDGGQTRLHQADEIIRYLVRLENVRGETQIGRSDLGIGRLNRDDRDL